MDFFDDDVEDRRATVIKLEPKHVSNVWQTHNVWNLQGYLLKVFSVVKEWILIQRPNQDTKIKFIVPQQHWDLFTTNIHNRFLAVFRKHYQNVVLLDLETPETKLAYEIAEEKRAAKREKKFMQDLEKRMEMRKHG